MSLSVSHGLFREPFSDPAVSTVVFKHTMSSPEEPSAANAADTNQDAKPSSSDTSGAVKSEGDAPDSPRDTAAAAALAKIWSKQNDEDQPKTFPQVVS